MSQHDLNLADQSGSSFRTDANNALVALASTSKGSSRPTNPQAGQMWVEDDAPSSTIWTLWVYDGADDIPLFYIDTNTSKNFVVEAAKPMQAVTMSGNTLPVATTYADLCSSSSTTTITALGTAPVGTIRTVYHSAAQQYTYNATSLITPGLANYTTTAGDVLTWYSLGSGNWRCIGRYNVSGTAGTVTSVAAGTGITVSGTPSVNPTVAVTNPVRAYVNFSGTTINRGFNVSSVTNPSTGNFTINFTSAVPSNAVFMITGDTNGPIGVVVTPGTTSVSIRFVNTGGTAVNPTNGCLVVF